MITPSVATAAPAPMARPVWLYDLVLTGTLPETPVPTAARAVAAARRLPDLVTTPSVCTAAEAPIARLVRLEDHVVIGMLPDPPLTEQQ